MSVQRVVIGEGEQRTPGPGGSMAEILPSAVRGPMAVVRVAVPPGGAMPSHDHGPFAIEFIPSAGSVRVSGENGDAAIEIESGTIGALPADERVQLENPGEVETQLQVVLAPLDFARSVKGMSRVS